MSVKIGIIDYGMGNLKSVYKAFRFLKAEPIFIDKEEDFNNCDGFILPGVGAFEDGMKNLAPFIKVLKKEVETKPILGICLGMQMLFSDSEENGFFKGLNLIPGSVKKLPEGLKVPHMGWNSIEFLDDDPLLMGIKNESYFYFVHSYAPFCGPDYALGETEYGIKFPSIVAKEFIYGTQFHPEKSGESGLKLLKNYISIVENTI
ncbi:MAG: imidazole glycerol phosphate synthase subunit HisH [Candidatus Methanofastidiosum sp.]|nr:imidazole glycerol phosphate synthase subunit HisH [Methanofastidiosum sp.]NYT12993.1 imidazole glycerol phosphate synthase subunit HisH [Candidatus Methanofastidiosa archaeon]